MIDTFITSFMENKDKLRAIFASSHPGDYAEIVKNVVRVISANNYWVGPDPKRVHEIDDGDYQGTLVFVIGGTGYQPRDYWYVRVGYGSCSGCDTLENIKGFCGGPPSEKQVDDYMTLALHIVQGLHAMGGEEV